ncbi:transposase [Pseudoalteromonas sp. HM-SA03]|uniref:Tn7-like element transposition protein TnsE n=1 Tax=Pseudoalteromonas sp. HM-SA03 TaxID=2029678 RepID=UPI000BADD7C1|nr:Tn7-like element transposition protein TnsE [Pseudoalteromonas sp. HM-SA03]PAX99839.1 transposase [Pseudoalteromonas sp. HM-SA03]
MQIIFKQIPQKAKLLAIGNLYRPNIHGSQWKIGSTIRLEDGSDKDISLGIEALCLLGIGRKFVQRDDKPYETMTFSRPITLPPVESWLERPLGLCGRMPKKYCHVPEVANQKCFVFESDGWIVWLPKFELARKLFFHTNKLASAACVPNGLEMLFNVEEDEESGETRISTMPKTGISAKLIAQGGYRNLFSWLLLNPGIKKSYESIWQCLNRESKVTPGYSRWQFNFEPPYEIGGVSIDVIGPYDRESNELLVWEIASIPKLPNSVSNKVQFFHPSIKRPVTNERGPGGKRLRKNDGIEVDLEEESDEDKQHDLIQLPLEGLGYSHPIEARLGYSGESKGRTGKKSLVVSDGDAESTDTSLGEDVTGGTGTPGDIDQLDDGDNPTQEQRDRFLLFIEIIKRVSDYPSIHFEGMKIAPLPKVNRCTLHALNDGTPRHYMLAKLIIDDGRVRYALEIDTSDRDSLSTKVFEIKAGVSHKDCIEKILLMVVKKSIHWPDKSFFNKYTLMNSEVAHPRSGNNQFSEEQLEKWKHRLLKELEK